MRKIILILLALMFSAIIFSACGKSSVVEVKNEIYGNISITPAESDTVVYPDKSGQIDIYGKHHVNIQGALIQNEKFDIILGYKTFKNDSYVQFMEFHYSQYTESVTFDGLIGYTYTESGIHYLFFPAKASDAARVVAIYSPATVGVAEGSRMSGDAARELAKTEEVQKTLETLKF